MKAAMADGAAVAVDVTDPATDHPPSQTTTPSGPTSSRRKVMMTPPDKVKVKVKVRVKGDLFDAVEVQVAEAVAVAEHIARRTAFR